MGERNKLSIVKNNKEREGEKQNKSTEVAPNVIE
jgi:hypothetical protein